MSFPRALSLNSQAEFKKVFDKATKLQQKYLLILFKENEKAHARLGISVSKRNVQKAVDRNRIKRIIRESFRLNQDKLQAWDIVVIARQQCDTLSKLEIRKGIDNLWEKLIRFQQSASQS